MKYILVFSLLCISCLTKAQLKTLWKPQSQTYPICNLQPQCDSCTCTYFLAGIYQDQYGVKICYQDNHYTSYCIYKKDIQYLIYDYRVFSDDVACLYFLRNGTECYIRFEIKEIPTDAIIHMKNIWIKFDDLK